MKKNLFITAASTLLFVACSNVDTFKEIKSQEGNTDEIINFSSYTDKLTKAENSGVGYDWDFYTHQATFRVWAYKSVSSSAETNEVFEGTDDDVVTVTSDGQTPATYTYDYNGAHYWDKSATSTYNFYAAAPSNGGNSITGTDGTWTFVNTKITGKSTQHLGYFTTKSKLTGVNLKSEDNYKPSTALTKTFKGKDDIDKMIAAPCQGNYNTFINATGDHVVQLNFIHILSKMNVTVKKDNTALGNKTVTLKGISINRLRSAGSYTEADPATGLSYADPNGSNDSWTLEAGYVNYSYSLAAGKELNATDANEKMYFIESLVIPQSISAESIAYDGTILDGSYADAAAYNAGHKLTGTDQLSDAQFAALPAVAKIKPAVYTDKADYAAAYGVSEPTDETFAALKDEEKAKKVTQDQANAEPYMVINYTIDGEPFESYHNLATSFKSALSSTLDFYEGFQNTLNINICPERIEFCADVATWDDKAVDPNMKNLD